MLESSYWLIYLKSCNLKILLMHFKINVDLKLFYQKKNDSAFLAWSSKRFLVLKKLLLDGYFILVLTLVAFFQIVYFSKVNK